MKTTISKSLAKLESKLDDAELKLREKLKLSFPVGTRVVVSIAGSDIVVEITKHSHRLREVVGFNVKTGSMRKFSYLHIVKVFKS